MTSLLQNHPLRSQELSAERLAELERYPESADKPMAENTEQYRWIVMIKENLEILFKAVADVFIAADLLWYSVPRVGEEPAISQAPDEMVVFGRPKGKRGNYQQWKENNLPPQVVFEILAPSNKSAKEKRAMKKKLAFYQTYGVEEYYIYDPDTFELQGYLRQGNQLETIDTLTDWTSPRLGIRFEWQPNQEPVLYHPDGKRFLSPSELDDVLQQERQHAQQERQRAEHLADYLRSIGINPDDISPSV